MQFLKPFLISTALCLPAGLAQADIVVSDAYARSSRPDAPVGAVFMVIENGSETADRLIAAQTSASMRAELHTHVQNADGVMSMVEVEDGIVIPAGGAHTLERGGDHVMLMGLTEPLVDGASISVTLSFEMAGDVTVEVPVDLDR
ncbi:copper chaperone PCu(A)C [Sulfitobacter sp. D35]|uniref:copper chaperone PCu(A)C n=1 Tax=Sulfitobacter sp. D35 TaxID=3083252 RepID=UPI00296FE4FF|nr:copper chaperone PCu(A)C [Sulfitobacter sp. D35]MDW4499128.1 copper chaperone PCu(A)C [Sulfitobacter sp. D35]